MWSLKIDKRTFTQIMIDSFQEFNSKSSQIRTNVAVIAAQLQSSHNPDFLIEHIETSLLNIIKKSLESDIPCEIDGAARIISLVAIQLPQVSS